MARWSTPMTTNRSPAFRTGGDHGEQRTTALTATPGGPDDDASAGRSYLDRAGSVAAHYAPDHLVVDQAQSILARSAGVSRFLRGGGTAGLVLDVVHGCLRDTLSALLRDAAAGILPARGRGVTLDGRALEMVIERLPADAAASDQFVILFLETALPAPVSLPTPRPGTRPDGGRFRRMTDLVPVILFTMTPDLVIDHVNRAFCDFTGLDPEPPNRLVWEAVLHPADHEENRQLWAHAVATGQAFEREHRLRAADGSWRWHLTRCVPQRGEDGSLLHWLCSSVDIHQRRRAEARQRLLLTELQHRSKNILAVVRSLLSRTLASSTDLDDFAAHLSGRISALARTQGVLARTVDGAVGLEELAHQEVMAHGGQEARQVTIDGPAVMVTDKVAETLGLALHELTTNALKFGALSTPLGSVSLTWERIRAQPGAAPVSHALEVGPHDVASLWEVALVWQESGVTIDMADVGPSGFGRELIEQGLQYELGAQTSMVFAPTGLRCEIRFPLRVEQEGGPFADIAA